MELASKGFGVSEDASDFAVASKELVALAAAPSIPVPEDSVVSLAIAALVASVAGSPAALGFVAAMAVGLLFATLQR